MAGARKANTNRYSLSIPAAAAGSANDVVGAIFVYDGFAEGGTSAGAPALGYDSTVEAVTEMSYAVFATLTGQGTNFVSVRVTHSSAAGVAKNQFLVTHSASGVVSTALVPVNLAVASGAVATGAGTGVLTVGTGAALPWTLVPGDTIQLDRLSNNGTGLATPAISLTFLIQQKGA